MKITVSTLSIQLKKKTNNKELTIIHEYFTNHMIIYISKYVYDHEYVYNNLYMYVCFFIYYHEFIKKIMNNYPLIYMNIKEEAIKSYKIPYGGLFEFVSCGNYCKSYSYVSSI
jgi:hypothetical protein